MMGWLLGFDTCVSALRILTWRISTVFGVWLLRIPPMSIEAMDVHASYFESVFIYILRFSYIYN